MLTALALAAWLGAMLGQQPCAAGFINSFAGPYITYTIAFLPCEEDASSWNGRDQYTFRLLTHFNPSRPREQQAYEGNVTLAADYTDANWLRVTVAKRSNNQWKQNAFVFNFPKGGCSAFRTNLPFMFEHVSGRSASSRRPCVISAGFHQIERGAKLNWTFPNVPVMPYGHWLFQARGGSPGNRVANSCWETEGKTIPKV